MCHSISTIGAVIASINTVVVVINLLVGWRQFRWTMNQFSVEELTTVARRASSRSSHENV